MDSSSPGGWSVQWDYSLAGQCFGEAVAVALGGDEFSRVRWRGWLGARPGSSAEVFDAIAEFGVVVEERVGDCGLAPKR